VAVLDTVALETAPVPALAGLLSGLELDAGYDFVDLEKKKDE